MKRNLSLTLLFMTLLWTACEKDQVNKPCDATEQETLIQDYLLEKNLTTETTGTGLHYIIDQPGTSIRPTASSTVSVIYRGTLTDGTEFDSSKGQPVSFRLNQVIAGWTEGIQLFREGGKGTLIVPCQLGYGDRPAGAIPASSVLIFEVELVDVR